MSFGVMESGRFSQSPAFLKRAGHNVEETTFYTATVILHCTFYPALLNTKLSKNYKIESPWFQKDIKLPMFHCLRKFGT